MKRALLSIFFVVVCLAGYSQSNIDVLHYKYEIELNDKNDSIYGRAEIEFVLKERSDVYFDLIGNAKKGMQVTYATVRAKYWPFGMQEPGHYFEHTDNKISTPFTISSQVKKGDTLTARINYKGIPSDGLIISKNKFGQRTFFSDNWPNRAHNWIPCNDDPADKATVEFIVTAPSHYQVISNGLLVEETNLADNKKLTHWKEDVPLPTKVIALGVADFAVNYVGDVNCIPVSSWVFPEDRKDGFYDYAQAKEILAFFINYIGPFPYKKLANVQSKTIFGGMENAGAIFYSENSINGKRQEEDLLAHEIVHQWFGDMATEKSYAHLWLSEGFATYLSHVFLEEKYGVAKLDELMQADREDVIAFVKSTHKPVVDSVSQLMQLLNANSYKKGGWVLHMLRRELGDSLFKKAIRQYYASYAGSNAETKDLQKVFEKVSGKDLSAFFKQWLFTPENPTLAITWKYDEIKKVANIEIKQLQKAEFQVPIELGFTSAKGKTIIQKLMVDSRMKSFTVPLTEKPVSVIADPKTSLLFEGTVKEIK